MEHWWSGIPGIFWSDTNGYLKLNIKNLHTVWWCVWWTNSLKIAIENWTGWVTDFSLPRLKRVAGLETSPHSDAAYWYTLLRRRMYKVTKTHTQAFTHICTSVCCIDRYVHDIISNEYLQNTITTKAGSTLPATESVQLFFACNSFVNVIKCLICIMHDSATATA